MAGSRIRRRSRYASEDLRGEPRRNDDGVGVDCVGAGRNSSCKRWLSLRRRPRNRRTRERTAIRAAANRMADALAEWDRRIATGSNEYPESPRRRDGVAYRVRGRLADALREFDAAIAERPNASDVQLLRALTLEVHATARGCGSRVCRRVGAAIEATSSRRTTWRRGRLLARPTASGRARSWQRPTGQESFTARLPTTLPFLVLDAIPDNLSRAPVVADGDTAQAFALLAAGHFNEAVVALRQPVRSSAVR